MLPESEVRAEKRLIAAVMELAIQDSKSPKRMNEAYGTLMALRGEASAWLHSHSRDPFGFLWCCEVIDLKPELVRQKLSEIQRKSTFSVQAVHKSERLKMKQAEMRSRVRAVN